ncbi:proline-rich domain-containing protein [Actinoplanes sp. CA-030573]|uniref:proline-rich domain-containing protein n=1 Tax=Actinoplanes sp. CA-030573 TaxID=3239898 RepID=UPI003D93F209
MRRLVFPAIAALGLVMVGPSSAFADDPAPTVSVKATAGKKVCKVTDPKLDELSGMVATQDGFVVVNDSTNTDSHRKIFFLDSKCKIVDTKSFGGTPRDPEDMILAPDGKTLWIADIGDNNFDKDDGTRRPSIGVWKMPLDGSKKPVLYRMKYPEGDYHDAEALLITGQNTPLIITKEIGTAAGLYEPTAALKASSEEGVPLKKVGTLTVSKTETAGNPFARIGNQTIDGAAMSADGSKVVLRTYTDAMEWDVTNGDVLAAIKGKPRITGLPNETLGESITYSADGKLFYTVSDMSGDHDAANYILSYVPSTEIAVAKKGSSSSTGAGDHWYSDLTIDQITYAVGAIGLVGLILVGVGVLGIARHRKRIALNPLPADRFDDDEPGDPETELIGVGGAPQQQRAGAGAGVYGGARSGPAGGPRPGGGPVYGSGGGQPGGGPQRGGSGPVYGSGGQGGGGPQYGRPPQGGQPARGPQGQPARGPQGQPPRGPQGQPPRGPQGEPARGPQGQPPRGPQGEPARAPQGQPPRGPQGEPARAPQGQPPRGPQPGGRDGVYGGRDGGARDGGGRDGGGRDGGGQPYGQPRGPQQGQRPQRPPQGGQPRGAQGGGQRGVYGQPGARDGYADRNARPEGRFDNPGYRR